jgi:hypothetical protein
VAATTRSELEAALARSFDHELLAVYGDLLQRENDPRGELIAIDLHGTRAGLSPELVARRTQILTTLIGPELAHQRWQAAFGLVEVEIGEQSRDTLAKFFASPLGPYVRSLVICGGDGDIKRNIGAVAECHHVWMRSFEIRHWAPFQRRNTPIVEMVSAPLISDRMATKLVRATPHLETLALSWRTNQDRPGRPIFAAGFSHPRARVQLGANPPRV